MILKFYAKTLEAHNNSHKYHTDMLAHRLSKDSSYSTR